jgi:iron complex transport system ATP-binding protein
MAIGGATLVDAISLRIEAGEMIAIVGPNGAGKSTLLRLMSGDLRATHGAVRLKQRDIGAYAPRELALHRAMLSQHVSVTFPFTVEEIVAMGAGDNSRNTAQPLVDAALEEVGLNDFRDRKLPTLSGGEQQRAHLARILVQLACGEAVHGPGLLLLDEPTSSLDMRHQLDLVETARRRGRNGTAVVAILHDLNLAMCFADRVILLHHGAMAADGSVRETITAETIRRIFEVDATIEHTENGIPFLLPQTMRRLASWPVSDDSDASLASGLRDEQLPASSSLRTQRPIPRDPSVKRGS